MIQTTLAERIEIVESSEKGEPTWRLARRLRWRPRTIQKWRRKGEKEGRSGLQSQMGRPAKGSLSSYPQEIAETIRRWRLEHPGWGAVTLRAELESHTAFKDVKIPSRASIGRFLSEEGLIASKLPSVPLPESEKIRGGYAHQVWEMDAQGYENIPDIGFVSLINLNDRYSHARLLSYPCHLGQERVERHVKTVDYQAALRTAFMEWGMPDALQVDHEGVFYNNKSNSPFPTRFHLWLIGLDISLSFIRHNQPQDQGMTERSHQLWEKQVIQGQTFSEWSSLFDALQQRREFLNYELPCRSLDDQPPLIAFPEAASSLRPYQVAFERELFDLQRIYLYLAQGRWFRLVSKSGTLTLGGQVYSIGSKWQQKQIEISFCIDSLCLRFLDDSGDTICTKPIKGLSDDTLIGDIADYSRLAPFQLALPFSWEQQQDARLYESIS